jgi:hypothetical protein
MKARVSGELKRGELSVSSTAVQSGVLSAIQYLKQHRFTWNEFHESSVTASSSATYVNFTDLAVKPITIDKVTVSVNNRTYEIERRSHNALMSHDATNYFGYPDYYAIQGESLRLYPVPNQNVTLHIAGVKELTEVSAAAATSATNAWMTEGEELVRLTAKAMLFRDELRAPEQANYFFGEALRVRRELSRRTSTMTNSGKLRAHR